MTHHFGLSLNLERTLRPQEITKITRVFCDFLWLLPFLFVGLAYAQETSRTVWDGVYNEEQAQRGQAAFVEQCSNCHGRNLEGADMTPALTGAAFMANWDSLTVGDLADRIRVSMPLNTPGTLSRQQTADVVAYILRFNQFPSGKEELPREVPAMKQIAIKASRP
jgi:mono/diheme cytochrome c family protein